MAKDRNQFVDIMRGIAMLLVVLGHTMTGCPFLCIPFLYFWRQDTPVRISCIV